MRELREQLAEKNSGYISDVSRNLYVQYGAESPPSLPKMDDNPSVCNDPSEYRDSQNIFNLNIATKLKEPSVPKSSESQLKHLHEFQMFDKKEWCELRYAETQKLYNHSPGFVELEVNEEIRAYDTLRNLLYAEKAYAALTFCFLKQRESLEETLRELLNWAKNEQTVTFENLSAKLTGLFSQGDFQKVSSDLLQLICGHRAEVIQMRRDGIINHVRDPLLKASLRKIPPSCHNLFNEESFSSTIEKSGGIRKCFWPLKKKNATVGGAASQAGPSKVNSCPSQGNIQHPLPSQGTSMGPCVHNRQATCCNAPPSQGASQFSYPTQGHNMRHTITGGSSNNSFRGRQSRPRQRPQGQYEGNRKRASSSSKYRGNKRRKY